MKKHVLNNYKLKSKENNTIVEGTYTTESDENSDEDSFEHYRSGKEM